MNDIIYSVLGYFAARLKEPSTYAGIAGLLVSAHIAAPDWAPAAVQYFGIALGSTLAIIAKELAPKQVSE